MTAARLGDALRGVGWGALSTSANVLAQLVLMACMSRLLSPADFGLMAMALLGLRFLEYFSQMGIGPALIQRPSLTGQDVRVALGLSMAVSLAFAAGIVLLAPLAAHFFGRPALTGVMQVLALNFVLLGLSTVSTALLRRAMRFRALALVETLAYVLGYGSTGLLLAWAGAGVWALVGATLAQSLLNLLLSYALARHPLRPSLRGDVRGLLGYGGPHSLIGFVEFLSFNVDTTLIGRTLGDGALGNYSRARLLAALPTEKVSGVLGRVFFPLLSGAQRDRERVGQIFLLGVLAIGLAGTALSLGISAAAGPLVAVMLGPQWQAAVPLVALWALCVPFQYMSHVAGIVCDALALLRPKLALQGTVLGVLLLGMGGVLPHGLPAVIGLVLAVEVGRWLLFLRLLTPVLALRGAALLRVHLALGLMGLLVWGGVSGVAAWEGLAPGARLLCAVPAGALATGLALALARPLLRPVEAYARLRQRGPLTRRWL